MKKNKTYQRSNQYYIICILLGILIGCISCAIIIQNNHSFITDFMIEKEMGWIDDVSDKAVFLYILKKRFCCFCIFICLSFLFSPQFAFCAFLFLWGGYYGMFTSMMMFYKNIDVFFNALLCFFPHSILYFFSILSVVNLLTSSGTYSSIDVRSKKKRFFKHFLKIFVIICGVGIGIFFEINSKFFLKTFFTNI